MNKRIALMTWHHTENYGTAYQAYALSKLIESAGCEVDLIDYRRLGKKPLGTRSIVCFFVSFFHIIFSKHRYPALYKFSKDTFDIFWEKRFCYTAPCLYNQDFRELNAQYDGFVCGSDQIWGPEWFDARFFLDFVEDTDKLIAYSPSIGVSSVDDVNVRKEIEQLVNRFPNLSLREETGCRIVREMTGREDILNTLDPVLTLPVKDWDIIQEDVEGLPSKYFFIFFLKNNAENIKRSIDAANKKGCLPILLHCTQSDDTPFANTGDVTPGQLLTYIKNAEYVCTDSFHMTVLSLIYEKNFKVFKKDTDSSNVSKNNRITDLLYRLDVVNAEFDEDNSFNNVVDYTKVTPLLNILREKSYNYLRKALNSLPEKRQELLAEYECEKKVGDKGYCDLEQSCAFIVYGRKQKGIKNILYKEMTKFPFALQEKCYRCKYYQSSVKIPDNRKPLFWGELNVLLLNDRSIFSIFKKYYLAYYVSNLLKRII